MTHNDVQQAAVTLFAEKGFAATGIRDIGAAAGVNSATLYHYVSGKESLLSEIVDECLNALLQLLNEVSASSADPAVQLVKYVRVHVAFGAMNPLTSRVTDQSVQVLTGQARESAVALRDAFESILEKILQRGKLTNVFHISDPGLAKLAIIEMNNGIADWYRQSGRLTIEQVQKEFSEFSCRLAGASHPAESEIGELPVIPVLPTEPTQ